MSDLSDSRKKTIGELEERLRELLFRESFHYTAPTTTVFPQSVEIIHSKPSPSDKPKRLAVVEILQWGLLINQVYQRKLEMMFKRFKNWKALQGIVTQEKDVELVYSRDAQSFFDLGERFYPNLKLNFVRRKTIPRLKERGFFPFKNPNAEDLAFKLIELSIAYDKFALTPCYENRREEERKARYEGLDSDRVYETLVSFYSPLSDFCSDQAGRMSSVQLDILLQTMTFRDSKCINHAFSQAFQGLAKNGDYCLKLEERNYVSLLKYFNRIKRDGVGSLDLARRTISALGKVVNIGMRESKQNHDTIAVELSNHLSELERIVAPTNLHIGFNSNWKENYEDRLNICLSKGNKWAGFSILYSLDPHTKLLFFTADNNDKAQAEVIFFDAEDEKGKPYLVLEGLVLNEEFTKKMALRQDRYPCLMPHLFSPHLPQYALDVALHHVFRYAQEQQKDLFINMKEVTSMKEYGPHEMLSYLSKAFPQVDYTFVIDDAWTGKRKFVYGEGGQRLYLRKNNQVLFQKLQEMGVSIPPELLSHGKLLLYNHTWGNPREEDSLVNTCEGQVQGIVITKEAIAKFLKRS